MANFFTQMKETQGNVSKTENGMTGYKTTFHPLLDMNFKLPSYRGNKAALLADLKAVMDSNDSEYILKYLFYVRDAREGLGERDTFRTALHTILDYDFENKDIIIENFINQDIQEYGRFDDLFNVFVGTPYESILMNKIKKQLSEDFDNMKNSKPISLLAKWMPSANTSSPVTRKLANIVIKALGSTPREYRKLLSALRSYLKVIEVSTSSNDWGSIDYNAVPSLANLKYKNAFLKHDEERRRDYLAALRVGVDKEGKQVKINSSVNYPHDIVHKYFTGNGTNYYGWPKLSVYDEALEQLWKNLKQMPGLDSTIVVRDGSGSMTSRVPNSDVMALEVADALTIYCAERLNDDFKDKFITFSRTAKLVELNATSLRDKLVECRRHTECENTDILNVFELILNTGKQHQLSPDDMPKQILIISDMEFDGRQFNGGANVFEYAANRFAEAGYTLPKLVFWNVNSRSNTVPMLQNKSGIILVSGFSVNILDMVMSGKTDPFDALVEKLNKPRYANIPLLILNSKIFESSKTKQKTQTRNKKKDIQKPSWL